ncbi:MAG: hypothetical protein JG762_1147 [Deferribacteraceae bacterium]|jgi:two-component system chemotaxis sensor kinase CheA|nr:hypothetical protein [Deferribacteraceae bacterium]
MIENNKLRELFVDEVLYHIRQARDFLNKSFESSKDSAEVFKIVKVFHTIKGSAGIMGLEKFADILHTCETFFQAINKAGYTPETKIKAIKIIDEIETLISNFPDKFDQHLKNLEDIISSKNEDEAPIEKPAENIKKDEIRTSGIKINTDIVAQLRQLAQEVTQIVEYSFSPVSNKEKKKYKDKVSELFQHIENITLVSLEELTPKIKNIAHYTATKLNKDINIDINFNKVGVDKRFFSIVEEALIHLVRNSISHGIESPEVRKEKGKNDKGSIIVTASSHGSKIKITVEDDGQGINIEAITKKAIEQNILTENEAKTASANMLINLIFRPNFSTAETIDNISGRGIGLDIVKERVEAVGGLIKVSTSNKGTKFILEMPVSFNIMYCGILSTKGEKVAIPLYLIDRFISIKEHMLIRDNRSNRIIYNEKEYEHISISNFFATESEYDAIGVIVMGKETVLSFEKYEGEKLFYVKQLTGVITSVPNIIGFAVDDTFRPIAIINPLTISSSNLYPINSTVENQKSIKSKKHTALVADDNNLIKEMISDFLKGENIDADTAQNGVEALKLFKNNNYDIIITDIEMPEMDGISLLKEVRSGNKVVPVIILSSKGDENDIKLALKNGANGYFVKKFFTRENFIKKVKSLL